VLRVVATYGVAAFGALQGADVVVSALGLPKSLMTGLVVLVIAGLPISAVLAWIFDLTPEGVVRTPALREGADALAATGQGAASGASSFAGASATAAPAGRSWLAVLLGVSAALLGLTGAMLYWQRARAAPLARELVAVFPFKVLGAGQYAYLREGMVELLGTGLSVGGLRAVDERVLLRQLERGGGAELDPEAAQQVAQRFGAGLFVLGSVTEAKDELQLRAQIFDSQSGSRLAEVSTTGPAARLFAQVDELLLKLRPTLLQATPADPRGLEALAQKTTTSLPALKAFLEGEQALRKGRFDEAVRSDQKAVAEDPGFALAHYRLAVASSWTHDTALGRVSLQKALASREKLPPRQRKLFEAFAAYWQGRAKEAEGLYQAIVAASPEDAESWYQLGEVIFHNAASQGRPISDARAPFETALKLDPDQTAPVAHLLQMAQQARDRELAATLLARLPPQKGSEALTTWTLAFLKGDPSEAELRAKLPHPLGSLAAAQTRFAFGAPLGDLLASLDEELARPDLDEQARTQLQSGRLRLLLVMGRRKEALEQARAALAQGEHGVASVTGFVASAPWLPHTKEQLQEARALLAAAPPPKPGGEASRRTPVDLQRARDSLDGRLAALLGDQEGVARAAARLEESVDEDSSPLGRDLALGVRALAASTSGDPAKALALLEQQSGGLPLVDFGDLLLAGTADQWLRAEVLQKLGRTDDAARWFDAMGPAELPFWLAPLALRQGQLLEAQGKKAEAQARYSTVLATWGAADPDLQPVVEEARSRLALLAREPGPMRKPATGQ
jgi:Tfp pilus assembly protein PilF/TolB-like protein